MNEGFSSVFAAGIRAVGASSPLMIVAAIAATGAAIAGCPGAEPHEAVGGGGEGAGGRAHTASVSSSMTSMSTSTSPDVSTATGVGGANGDGGQGVGGVVSMTSSVGPGGAGGGILGVGGAGGATLVGVGVGGAGGGCPMGEVMCANGTCANVLTDPQHCGSCDRACSTQNVDTNATGGLACTAGVCSPKCLPGFINDITPTGSVADDGCETQAKRVFVTSTTAFAFTDPSAGVQGANAFCRSVASNVGETGPWRAWLSDGNNSPSTTFDTQFGGAYVLMDGSTVVARTWTGLTTMLPLAHAINMDETKTLQDNLLVWTATTTTGTKTTDCNDWMTTDGGASAEIGITNATGHQWTQNTTATCDQKLHVYCFEQ
jgi:hypothetical protein